MCTGPVKRLEDAEPPEKWDVFKRYNGQDVITEMEDYQRLKAFPLPDEVQRDWVIDYDLNLRGIQIDTDLVKGALQINSENKALLLTRAEEMTRLVNPCSRSSMLDWLHAQGVALKDLTKETVSTALKTAKGPVKEVLEIWQRLSKSSVSKYEALDRATCHDGRIRGTLQYYGAARTGRWAGRLVQVQNLPHDAPTAIDTARSIVKKGERKPLKMLYGNIPNILSQLIRSAFIARKGCQFVVADFSAIEARVLAWLAGESWRMKVFKEGGDIYCATAERMFHCRVVKHGENGDLRQKGKQCELSCGYGKRVRSPSWRLDTVEALTL